MHSLQAGGEVVLGKMVAFASAGPSTARGQHSGAETLWEEQACGRARRPGWWVGSLNPEDPVGWPLGDRAQVVDPD